jgi:hypothetical protein
LTEIFDIQAEYGAHIFATSRFNILKIMTHFNNGTSLEIRARDEDVAKYLDEHISQSESVLLKANREEIRSRIIAAVDGMYVHTIVPNKSF